MSITLAFDSILNFLSDLAEAFPESSAKPYFEYISDIKAGDKDKQTATVNLFHDFCASNRDEIIKGSLEEIKDSTFSFGDSKSFDLREVFGDAAFAANKDIILKHLLTISALVDKDSNAKQVLISMERESIFNDPSISGLFGKITEDIEKQDLAGTTDPMKMIENLMKSESFGTLVSSLTSKVQNGEINVNNLIGMAALGNGVLGQQVSHKQ
jgi:hypothetical protein